MNGEAEGTKHALLSEASLVAGLGVVAYGLSFAYEASYFAAFGIPLHLVQTRLDTIFAVAGTLSAAAFLVYGIVNFLAMTWPRHPALQIKIVRIAVILLYPLWPIILFGTVEGDVQAILMTLLAVGVFEFAWPVFVFRDRRRILDRFEADEDAEAPTRSRTLFGRIYGIAGPFAYAAVVTVYFAIFLAHTAGRAEATRKRDFYVLDENPKVLVVRIYPDLLIGVRLNESGEVDRRLVVRTLNEQPLVLRKQRLGPLRFPSYPESQVRQVEPNPAVLVPKVNPRPWNWVQAHKIGCCTMGESQSWPRSHLDQSLARAGQ